MSIIASAALVLLAQGAAATETGPATDFDVGQAELVRGENLAAIAAIDACDTLAADDPARLINSAVALARLGRFDEARALLERAAGSDSVELETAGGNWVDSRRLARRGLAMLEEGDFARYYALSMR